MKYILIPLAFIILALLLIHPAGEADTWMHIKTGQIIVEDTRMTRVDEYSYTKAGEEWLNHQWLSQVIFYFVYKLSGINGLIIFSAIVIFLAFIFFFINIYRKDSWLLAVFLMLLVIVFSQDAFLARPLIFSLFLFSLFIFILHRYKYLWRSKKENLLYVLIPLQILWVNLHGASIMGVFLIWAFIIGEFIDTRIRRDLKGEFIIKGDRYKRLLLIGIILTVVTGLTPYGYNAILFPIREFKEMSFITEWLPSVHKDIFLNFGVMPYYRLFLFISVLVFIFRGRIISSSHIIIFVPLLYLSLSGKRHLPLYGFAIAPCVIEYLKDIKLKAITSQAKKLLIYGASIILILYLALLGKDIFTGKYYVNQNIDYWFGLGKVDCPDEAMDFLEKSGLEGNMFNDYASGCFLIARFYPAKKVFLDGRNTIYGAKFITENYVNCLKTPSLFDGLVKRYDINYVFLYYGMSNTEALIPHLFYNQNWQLVYFDDKACIFARNTEKNAGVIEKYHVNVRKRKEVVELNKYNWQSIYPRDYITRAVFYETLGLLDMAIDTLKVVVIIAPYVRDVHYNLGSLYLKKRLFKEAIGAFRQAIKLDKKDAYSYNNMGVAYANMAQYKEAMRCFRKALWLSPLYPDAKRNLRMVKMDFEKEKNPVKK